MTGAITCSFPVYLKCVVLSHYPSPHSHSPPPSPHPHIPPCTDDSENESDMEEESGGGEHPLLTMQEKLHELNTAHDLVVKNSHQLMRQISEVEEGGLLKANGSKLKEKLTLFKLTTSAMVKV